MDKKNIISSIFVAFLLTALWFYIYQDLSDNQVENGAEAVNNEQAIATSTSPITGVSLDFEGNGEVVVEAIDKELTPQLQYQTIIKPIPDLDRKIIFPDDFPEDARQIMIDKIEEISQNLKNDPNSFSDWLYLGLNRKAINDYEGAKLVWEYATLINPNNFVVRGNLGDLNAYYLRDNQEAEKNYLKALDLGAGQTYLYFKTAEFYQLFLKDKQKARDIVQTGLKLNPNSSELQSLLNNLTTD